MTYFITKTAVSILTIQGSRREVLISGKDKISYSRWDLRSGKDLASYGPMKDMERLCDALEAAIATQKSSRN